MTWINRSFDGVLAKPHCAAYLGGAARDFSPLGDGIGRMSNSLYETDFHDWLNQQAGLLRDGKFAALDIDNLVEEIEGLSRNERNELKSRAVMLLMHLLKWHVQVTHRSASWSATIREQRSEIEEGLADSPSLRPKLEDVMRAAYPKAVRKAQAETGLGPEHFPAGCPYSAVELLDDAFLPG